MWQLSSSIDGMGDACRQLHLPVVGGNVSLYNESRGRDIDPTPIVGVLGLVDRIERRPPGPTLVDGDRLVVFGAASSVLAGSRWAWARGHRGGALPDVDFDAHATLCDLVRGLVEDGLVDGVHDVGEGGLALTLAEMAVRGGVGFRVKADAVDGHVGLFGEGPSRVVLSVAPSSLGEVHRRHVDAGVPAQLLGDAGGDRLVVDGLLDVSLEDATVAWRDALPSTLGHGTVQG
jgi:phosphoribosylformylglycinamidine synthase